MSKISRFLLVGAILSVALMSCGQDAEKRYNVDRAMYQLFTLVGETTPIVETAIQRGLLDWDAQAGYNTMIDAVNELVTINLDDASNDDLDVMLVSINQMIGEVSNLKAQLQRSL